MSEFKVGYHVWIYVPIEVIIAICGLIGNVYLIFIFFYDPKLRVNRNFYLISLSFANILTCLVEVPLTILLFFRSLHNNNDSLCYIELSIVCFVRILVNYATAAIALDRLRAVRQPFEYREETSKKFPLIVIGFCWIISLIVGFWAVKWKTDGKVCTPKRKFHGYDVMVKVVFGKFAPFVCVLVFYGMIAASIFQMTKATKARPTSEIVPQIRIKAEKKEIKSTLRITWIVLTLTICEMPLIISGIFFFFKVLTSRAIFYPCLITAHMSAFLNPFLYAYNLDDFRKSSKRLWTKRERMRIDSVMYSDTENTEPNIFSRLSLAISSHLHFVNHN